MTEGPIQHHREQVFVWLYRNPEIYNLLLTADCQDTGSNRRSQSSAHPQDCMSTPKCSVSLSEFDAYGFDIDHTLAAYNIPNLFELLHSAFAQFLVKKKGYHKDLLQPFHKYKQFCARGLVFDIMHGNFLKIAKDGTILRASHGTTFLTSDAIKSTYPGQHWEPTDNLVNHVNNLDGEYMIFDNFFDMIGTVILSRIVELVDKKAGLPLTNYKKPYGHVKEAFTDAYETIAFAAKTGGFFPPLISDPARYINKVTEDTRAWIKSLRQKDKVVFFLSSSYIDFATFSLEHILGENWMDYFDIGVTRARKPGFFHANRPFLTIDGMSEGCEVKKLERGQVYSQGNLDGFTEFIAQTTGKENPKVVYFGDSIRSDTFPSQLHAAWTTVTVLAELEGELSQDADTQPPAKRSRLDETRQLPCGFIPNSPWGSFYTDTLPTTDTDSPDSDQYHAPTLNTLWGHILGKYSTIAVPSLQHVTGLPSDHAFQVFNPDQAGQWGFYPAAPSSLTDKPGRIPDVATINYVC